MRCYLHFSKIDLAPVLGMNLTGTRMRLGEEKSRQRAMRGQSEDSTRTTGRTGINSNIKEVESL